MATHGDVSVGDVFAGRYRIEAAIGEGGYGAVFVARRLDTNETCALKVMHLRLAGREKELKRFERESAFVTRLDHPNIVKTLDYGHTAEGVPFIAFELLEGQALRAKLKAEGGLSMWRVGQIGLQVLRALDHAHRMGVVHRDIKPANIFLCAGSETDFARVLDFGIAKALDDDGDKRTKLTSTGQILGTPRYMAPEQVKGGEIGPLVDLYALGLTLAECLTGKPVMSAPTDIEMLMEQMRPTPVALSEAVRDSPLAPVIARAVARAPGDRHPSAQAMLVELEAVLGRHRAALGGTGGGGAAASATSARAAPTDPVRAPSGAFPARDPRSGAFAAMPAPSAAIASASSAHASAPMAVVPAPSASQRMPAASASVPALAIPDAGAQTAVAGPSTSAHTAVAGPSTSAQRAVGAPSVSPPLPATAAANAPTSSSAPDHAYRGSHPPVPASPMGGPSSSAPAGASGYGANAYGANAYGPNAYGANAHGPHAHGSNAPVPAPAAFPTGAVVGPATTPAPRRGGGRVALVAVAILVVAGGGGAGIYFATAGQPSSAGGGGTARASDPGDAPPTRDSSAAHEPSASARAPTPAAPRTAQPDPNAARDMTSADVERAIVAAGWKLAIGSVRDSHAGGAVVSQWQVIKGDEHGVVSLYVWDDPISVRSFPMVMAQSGTATRTVGTAKSLGVMMLSDHRAVAEKLLADITR